MSSTPVQRSAVRKANLAYVDVPPSPLTAGLRRHSIASPHVAASSTTLKENTPLRPSQFPMTQISTPSTSLKRKLLDREPSGLVLDGVIMSSKKPKLTKSLDDASCLVKTKVAPTNASEEFPNGFAYCHQCNKKRDTNVTIACTNIDAGVKKERHCKAKYCKACLRNRYNEDLGQLKQSTYQCPRCRNICNCRSCRNRKGLEPLGAMNPPGKKKTEDKISQPKATKSKVIKEKTKETTSTVTKVSAKPKPKKPLPTLNWERVSTILAEGEANDRIFIREFVFRFGDYLQPAIAKAHLEELEFVAGRPARWTSNVDETTRWVGDMTIKVLVTGFLGLFASHRDGEVLTLIKATLKEMRSGGVNLNLIWSLLASLREDIAKVAPPESSSDSLTFSDPSPPPAGATLTRSLRTAKPPSDGVNIVTSSQMIPVLVGLIHEALQTSAIRNEIEQGLKDNRDVAKDAKEATRLENERWEQERKTIEGPTNAKDKVDKAKDKARVAENRVKRQTHKDNTTRIENALKIVSSSFSPRFMTLGTDSDGRVYYGPSPGVAEREAALDFLDVASSEKYMKMKKKARLLNEDERREMREWSWFVAVWGTKPNSSAKRINIDDEDKGENAPHWWGFWDVEEINKLAEWVSIKSGLDDDDESVEDDTPSAASSASSSSKPNGKKTDPKIEQFRRLVRGLKDYATLLEWRIKEDKYLMAKKA